jgi:RND family efflux transporter MFP subunit
VLIVCAACHRDVPEAVDTVEAVPVTIAEVRTGRIQSTVHAAGIVTAAPGASFDVTAPESARIAEIPHAEGDRVRKGDLLLRFDIPSRTADVASRRAEIGRAEAKLALARSAEARARSLFDRGVAARREVEQAAQDVSDADAAVTEARAALTAARTLAARTAVRSPFDGLIAKRTRNPGDLAEPGGGPILTVIDPRRLEVTASIPIAAAPRVREGAPAAAHAASGPVERLRVVAPPAAIDAATGAGTARLAFLRPTSLAAGTPVDVVIDAEAHDRAIVVPREAVVREDGTSAVFVVRSDRRAHRQEITVGLSSDAGVEVTSGLQAGDRVIVNGQNGLPDGAPVTVGP